MLNWKAVVVGAAIDFVGTYLATFLQLLLWAAALKLQGVADDDLLKTASQSPLFLAVSVTIGWYFDYLGGKFAGRIAKRQGFQHGMAAAIPGVILAFADTVQHPDPMFPAWFMVVCCAVSLFCACYGGARAVQDQEPEAT